MGVTLLKQFKVSMADGSEFFLYSERDLGSLDSELHYCRSIEPTNYVGLGHDGVLLYDGHQKPSNRIKPEPEEHGVPLERIRAGMNLAQINETLAAHKRAKKG
jgi:hypothetical protein